MMQNQQTCSRLNDDSSNEEENDSIELNLVLCALLALVPLTGVCVCVCSSDPCSALPGPANLLEQRAGLLHGAGVTCLSYRIFRVQSVVVEH